MFISFKSACAHNNLHSFFFFLLYKKVYCIGQWRPSRSKRLKTTTLRVVAYFVANITLLCLFLCPPSSRSFVWSSLGVTAMAFVTGALAFWTPVFLSRARVTQGLRPPCREEPCNPLDRYSKFLDAFWLDISEQIVKENSEVSSKSEISQRLVKRQRLPLW